MCLCLDILFRSQFLENKFFIYYQISYLSFSQNFLSKKSTKVISSLTLFLNTGEREIAECLCFNSPGQIRANLNARAPMVNVSEKKLEFCLGKLFENFLLFSATNNLSAGQFERGKPPRQKHYYDSSCLLLHLVSPSEKQANNARGDESSYLNYALYSFAESATCVTL